MKRVVIGLLLANAAFSSVAATTIDPAHPYAYGANVGWANWLSSTNGAVIGDFVCSGSIYLANCGWAGLGSGSPVNGMRYSNSSAMDYGVNHDGQGNLRGFAYAANIGWISFETNGAPKVDLTTGVLSGYVYSANCGWISLSNGFAYVRTLSLYAGQDSDYDTIADAWEIANFGSTNVASAVSDFDADGALDREEYLADTNPRDAGNRFAITEFKEPQFGLPAQLTWTSQVTRKYRIQRTDDLFSPSWQDSGLGLLSPDGLKTTRSVDTSAQSSMFRVQAVRPLSE